MSYLESLKEIYNSIKPEMSYCIFAPDLDADKWEAVLNKFAPQEEPISVLCIGEASLKGILSVLSAKSFLLTNEKLYMEKIEDGMKFSDILSISYHEEEKNSLFGKNKVEGFIIIKKTSGEKENLKGNYATKEIAEFLNKAVSEFKKNPPPPIPYKNHQNINKITDIIKTNIDGNEKYWKIVPDKTDKEINSFIIHCAKDEMKSCFAAIYEDTFSEKLYFTNDFLYYHIKSGKLNKVKYEELSNASYFEKEKKGEDGKIIFSRNVTLYNKNQDIIFKSSNAEKSLADIFNNIISSITGKDVKTEVHKEKDVFFSLLEKWDNIFKTENLIVDPKKLEDRIDYVTKELRLNRYKQRNIKLEEELFAKTMNITRYSTDKIMLEVGTKMNKIKYIYYNQNLDKRLLTSEMTDYFVRYYSDKNNKDAYLLFCFDVEDWDKFDLPCGFLRLEFKNGEMELKCEEVLDPDVDSRNKKDLKSELKSALKSELEYAFGVAGTTSYSEANTGLEKLLSQLSKKEVAKHLFSFIEHPYIISPEEQEQLERIKAKKLEEKAEKERILEEKRKAEEEARQKEKEIRRAQEEAKKRKEQEEVKAKQNAALNALNDF
ncbi:hypothetical protein [Treponema denticola]|jgi:hypothetical protein|uniref:hypothetical protein n=1 Tax=Treponema denticola TaxID=158 RepID=UPI0020A3ED1C|nr:hypothetical protein [Treponema denticola]UYT07234.1 hypothetical protein OE909_09720 [Treponema denticola]